MGKSATGWLRREWALPINLVTTALFLLFSKVWFTQLENVPWLALIMVWLLVVILASAFAIVRHAEALAERLGEPLGTLILTLAVTGIEVMMIAAVMYSGGGGQTLARDAMFAVVMVVLNGMVGLSLLLGGLRHREQTYNLQGANAFLAVILPLSVLGLVLPDFTVTTPGPIFSGVQAAFLIVMSTGLYAVFLTIQNVRHRDYFLHPEAAGTKTPAPHSADHGGSIGGHTTLLISYLLPMVVLAEKLAIPLKHATEILHAPPALEGLLVAILILSPESLAAIHAALDNQLQRSVNILLGSVLATISLTIPSVLIIGFITHHAIVLGLEPVDIILLLLTMGVSTLTFASPRTNVLLGAIHLLLFCAYLMLIFEK
jgi:Ca2+:H+ antiporter